ncbi:MAG: hypothetical protein S4CHLAM45_00960 [Chlamydiales bacterium]|nr:hypothetical protein [Chlamydiales bacterium]MCH9619417.1 hypothetical protein [Chlamydiales bacterium]MCH9622221.1 hypothetical protein [Chlamydiales bacterium]
MDTIQKKDLIEATSRLRKKLGGARTVEAIEAIEQGDFFGAVEICLQYYDKAYDRK